MRHKKLTSITAALLLGLSLLVSFGCGADGDRGFDNGPLGTLSDPHRVLDQYAQQMIEAEKSL